MDCTCMDSILNRVSDKTGWFWNQRVFFSFSQNSAKSSMWCFCQTNQWLQIETGSMHKCRHVFLCWATVSPIILKVSPAERNVATISCGRSISCRVDFAFPWESSQSWQVEQIRPFFACSYCLFDSASESLRAGPIEHETQKSQEASSLSSKHYSGDGNE